MNVCFFILSTFPLYKMMTPFNQQPGIPLFNQTTHRVSCCMVIPFGIGVPLVLTSWIVGKQKKNPTHYNFLS